MKGSELLPLLPELIRAGLRRALAPLRNLWRRGWIYRRLLKGPLADHIVFHPWDALPRRLEEADSLLRGRFRFHGQTVDVPAGVSVFDVRPPSEAWHEALHSFHWLPALSTAGGEASRKLATNLIGQWIKRHQLYSEPAWLPHIMARRLAHIFSHGRLVILNSEMMWRSRLFVSLREQARMLERISGEAPDGLPRLETCAVLALSGLCLDDSSKRRDTGLSRLESEIERQILPDGGHVSRSPEALLSAYRHVIMVMEALSAVNEEPPHGLRNAHDRMAPMLRFFRHADGALALFNGGAESDPRMIAGLLARDDIRGQPFHHARHSGYQRLTAGRTLCMLDCGKTPDGAFALNAHAGAAAFELSSGADRIVVNCGAGGLTHQAWNTALRATAAHSTLTLSDTSSAHILPAGLARDLLGPRLMGGPVAPVSKRMETAQGWTVEVMHDAYEAMFGIRHERQLTLSPQGLMVTGRDRLVPVEGKMAAERPGAGRSYAVRFHIHPDVRVSRLEGGGILLKLPGGEGWRFRAGGGTLEVEESVYLGGPVVRRTEQLVITGQMKDSPAEIAWVFEQIVA
ncbi:MAG: Heparinase family protein [Alphaproteobacteria bacterium]|nr:Heparinase family protein [Alphaproteobacteria bacterium]